MKISVAMNGKIYGGYEAGSDYSVNVEYSDFDWDSWKYIDFDTDKKICKKVEKALLGKKTPCDIKSFADVIVHKGETIARLHLKEIFENWYSINFGAGRLAHAIDEIKSEYCLLILKTDLRGYGAPEVDIAVRYALGGMQQGGTLRIPIAVAKWLIPVLEQAVKGDLPQEGSMLRVTSENE
jgi:hypothetical protein